MNRLARYHAQGGRRFVVIPRPYRSDDILDSLPYWRRRFLRQRKAGHELRLTEYGWTLQLAMKKSLHTLVEHESNLRVVAAYRAMLEAA